VRSVLVIAAASALSLLPLASACSGGDTPQEQIQSRVQSFVNHYNADDAKAILDDDLPPSFRRTCSDADAKQTIQQARRFASKISAKSVDNVQVTGDKATARVVFDTGASLLPQAPALTVPFVKDAGAWRFDTGASNGCNNILPTSLGKLSG
jgi:hypothetical protein